MQVGDLIRLNSMAVRVCGLRTDCGVIVDRVPSGTGDPDDYCVLIDGAVHRIGYMMEQSAEVINASR
jgi:hypothetical protein